MVTATDELLLLQDAAKQLLGSNTPSSVTIWRWGSQGLRGRSGERVLLRTETRFGRRCTTVDWMRRFLEQVAGLGSDTVSDHDHIEQGGCHGGTNYALR